MRKFLEFCQCPRSLLTKLTKPTFEDIKLAIWKLQIDKIQQLLSQGAPTHQKGQTILHFATVENKLQAVQFIVSHCIDLINEKNQDGDTALMLALFSNNVRIIKCLLLHHSDFNIRDNNGNTPFIIAAANGNIPALEEIMESCNSIMVTNFQGQTALHRAAYYGELETIKFLLENTRLKLYQTDKNNNNSLHMACMNCNIICIRYIINKVKQPHKLIGAKNKQGKKPLEVLEEMISKINTYKKQEKIGIGFEDVLCYIFGKADMRVKTQ